MNLLGQAGPLLDAFGCGKADASFTVNVEAAKKVMDKWGTDALKSRLAAGNNAA